MPESFYTRAAHASLAENSRGRLVPEPASPTRTPFQRDRDRIIHSAAFRRLQFKTQVFVFHEGDHYRTRLTHTLEVAQVARSLARALCLDVDLSEAIALAHDLGHSPFGHAGERALDAAMHDFGGFDHNAQSLRIVTRLERRYAAFDGLNLTWETLEGIVKHNGPIRDGAGMPAGAYAGKDIPGAITEFDAQFPLDLATYASAEAQVAALSDDIAYNAHDVDDGLRAGLFELDEICAEVPLIARIVSAVDADHPWLDQHRRIHETFRRLITQAIESVLERTQRNVEALRPRTADDVRGCGEALVAFDDAMRDELQVLRGFLFKRMYRHARVNAVMAQAAGVVDDLFGRFMHDPALLPEEWGAGIGELDTARRARRIGDYIAGMTDRYALAEHRRLFDRTPDLR
ncbi:MAG: deoxyguanosinetriphosphate triphosphohydrolase [Rhodobiaceae bacterium]|nr:deoxyguanosinetriphosphate triphosphohydrolase [Rhodobiaceae bacterium]MCC0052777.1 deoxyguanosinetriphosphate triphosphohydrolase [Rhodobiaceae bacterium]